MKKEYWIGVLVLVVLVGGYLGRHKIRALLSGSYGGSAPTYQAPSSAPASSGSVIMTQSSSSKGSYLTGPNGMTLYTFDKDTKGVSNCTGGCATTWPPYTTASAPASMPAKVGTITRSDGTTQFTYNGMPLYYYSGDSAPGDINGDGFNGIWHLVKP